MNIALIHPPEAEPAACNTHTRISLQTEVLRGEQAFETLRNEWQDALLRMQRPSIFITPAVLELSWKHLSNKTDEPWFVVVRKDGVLVGLLPLVLTRDTGALLLRKVLRHMGMLTGDRPGILHTIEASEVWHAAMAALMDCRRQWHRLDLGELDDHAWPHGDCAGKQLLRQRGLRVTLEPDTQAGYLRIEGSWDVFLQSRSRNTRQAYGRSERRLLEAHPDLRIEVVDRPDQIKAAFDRYISIDARSWKKQAGIEFWYDARQQDFLRELLHELALAGKASVWLLAAGDADIAGLVRLSQGSIMYERCSTYDPAYSRYSPSTYLCMQAVRRLFGSEFDESDVMGLPEPMENRLAIRAWYPGLRPTWRLRVLSVPAGYLPMVWAKSGALSLYRYLRRRYRGLSVPSSAWALMDIADLVGSGICTVPY